jgi:hypothetical protein
MFSTKDLEQINKKGIQISIINQQIDKFIHGFPFLKIQKAATIQEGILKMHEEDLKKYNTIYEQEIKSRKILKFVPASGAATRMFKDLFSFIEKYKGSEEEYNAFTKDTGANSVNTFFLRLKDFAFYDDLKTVIEKGGNDMEDLIKRKEFVVILKALLSEDGLGYGTLPKGLLKFHRYIMDEKVVRTPVEEHLVEGANYCASHGKVSIHFTVSPEHESKFREHIKTVLPVYETLFKVHYDITFSIQKASTDTIAVDMENAPFRNSDGSLLFRPAGHGALIENLNDIEADLIFVKNIDNVVPDRIKSPTYVYKKALGGVLVYYQTRIFNYISLLEGSGEIPDAVLSEISVFLQKELSILPPKEFSSFSKELKITYLISKLNRPIRVCGMVKNEGEAGGGPFWAENPDGTISLQIAESSQIDMKNDTQNTIAKNATHFNPVDLVCGVKNHKGKKFDLLKYTDPETGFISSKSKDGKDLKAQELPGLWNGAMSDWNTLFLEVPIITFNPVKSVNDLLREEHQ